MTAQRKYYVTSREVTETLHVVLATSAAEAEARYRKGFSDIAHSEIVKRYATVRVRLATK